MSNANTTTTGYKLEMRDDQETETVFFDHYPTDEEITTETKKWVNGGEWANGATVDVTWKLFTETADTEDDESEDDGIVSYKIYDGAIVDEAA